MAEKFATKNAEKLFKESNPIQQELRHQNLILERQGEREEERFYEDRIYQIRIQLSQATDPQQQYYLQQMLEEEIQNLEEVEEANRRKERARKIMYFLPGTIMLIIGVYALLAFGLSKGSHSSNSSSNDNGVSVLAEDKSNKESSVSAQSSDETIILSSTSTQPSFSDVDYEVEVQSDNLTLRDGPSINAIDLGSVRKGQYRIIQTTDADGYKWGRLASGQGWIALDFTTEVKPSESSSSEEIADPKPKHSETQASSASGSQEDYQVRIRDNDSIIYDRPSKDAKDLGKLPSGLYTIIETREMGGSTWGRLKSGQGWIIISSTKTSESSSSNASSSE